MKIQINNVEYKTEEMDLAGLKDLLKTVNKERLQWSGQKYMAMIKSIEMSIGRLVSGDDTEVQNVFKMEMKTKEVELIAGVKDKLVFWPGVSLQYIQDRSGTKAIFQAVTLKRGQEWAWGSFSLSIGNMIVITGKMSKSRIKMGDTWTCVVSFDYESARAIDIFGMTKSGQGMGSSRHGQNKIFELIGLSFAELYPILDGNHIKFKVVMQATQVALNLLYPNGEAKRDEREERNEQRKKEIAMRQAERQYEEQSEKVREEML